MVLAGEEPVRTRELEATGRGRGGYAPLRPVCPEGRGGPAPTRGASSLGLGAAASLACVLLLGLAQSQGWLRPRGPQAADVHGLAGLSLEDNQTLASLLGANAGKLKGLAANVSNSTRQRFRKKMAEARANGTLKEVLTKALLRLAPNMSLSDGNPCRDDEELLNTTKLCYKKCSLLTDGKYPIRTTPWSCCSKRPCLFNQRKDLGVCSGFSIAGGMGSACPHAPGACLTNEELLGGNCYKKCGLLTGGLYPTRVGPASCCKVSGFRCWFPTNTRTTPEFNVGGGVGDGHDSTPASMHKPMPELTEQ